MKMWNPLTSPSTHLPFLEATESADEPTDPPSVFVLSRCNQLMEPLESTDGLMYPARVQLTETSERILSPEGTCPLVVIEPDTVQESSRYISNFSDATISAGQRYAQILALAI